MLNPRVVSLLALAAVTFAGCSHPRGAAAARATPTLASASRGAALFSENCAVCHGANGAGGRIGPALVGLRKREPAEKIRAQIEHPDPPMPKLYPSKLTIQDLNDIAAYVGSL